MPDIVQLRELADRDRLDLAAARQAVAVKADVLGVTRRFRYLGALELGPQWQWDDAGMRKVGPVLSAELPIFNQGAGRVARAEADLALREAELAALEIEIVTELDRTTAAVANAEAQFEQYRDGLIPARREIVARRQEDTNFMLAGPFELLNAKQEEYQAYRGSLEALTGYWLARVELARAAGPGAACSWRRRRTRRAGLMTAGPSDADTPRRDMRIRQSAADSAPSPVTRPCDARHGARTRQPRATASGVATPHSPRRWAMTTRRNALSLLGLGSLAGIASGLAARAQAQGPQQAHVPGCGPDSNRRPCTAVRQRTARTRRCAR